MATFATRLKELRTSKGLSQPQLAEVIGMTKQTISLWERGERRPDFETMERLSDYFEVNMKYLIGASDDSTPLREENCNGAFWAIDENIQDLESLFNQISQLSEDTRNIIAGAVQAAYRIDRSLGKLEDKYVIDVRLKNPM